MPPNRWWLLNSTPLGKNFSMKPIFQGMVGLSTILLFATFWTAYSERELLEGIISQDALHMLLGLTTTIILLMIHGFVILNYFIATGKAMDEALEGHPEHPRIKAVGRKLKMKSSPAATMSCIFIIAAAVLGGRAWQLNGSPWHWGLAWLAVAYNYYAFWVEYKAIVINMSLIEETREIWRKRQLERKQQRKATEAKSGESVA
jgi:hypothetical protein